MGALSQQKKEVPETCLQSISLIDLPAAQLLACFGILILSAPASSLGIALVVKYQSGSERRGGREWGGSV